MENLSNQDWWKSLLPAFGHAHEVHRLEQLRSIPPMGWQITHASIFHVRIFERFPKGHNPNKKASKKRGNLEHLSSLTWGLFYHRILRVQTRCPVYEMAAPVADATRETLACEKQPKGPKWKDFSEKLRSCNIFALIMLFEICLHHFFCA